MNPHGNTVLVTGGASGIGLAIAQAFSELGNRVLICGRDPEKLARAQRMNPSLHAISCDITKSSDVETMFAAIAEQHGGFNMLVNNAGSLIPSDFLTDDEALPKRGERSRPTFLERSGSPRRRYRSSCTRTMRRLS